MEHLPRNQYFAAQRKSQKFTVLIRRSTRKFHRKNSIHVDLPRYLVERKTMKKNVWHTAKVVSLYARKFCTGQWSFIGPGSEKKWYSMNEDSP